MTFDELVALGFYSVGGRIDYRNKNYGVLTPNGPVLTPEGHELYAALVGQRVLAETPVATTSTRRGRPPKASVAAINDLADELIGEQEQSGTVNS